MAKRAFVALFLALLGALSGCGEREEPPPAPSSSSWNIATVDSEGNVGQYSSIAVDGHGKAHIAYFEQTGEEQIGDATVPYGNLKYATNASGSWQVITLDAGAGMTPRIAVDQDGKVHIVHTKLGASEIPRILDLKYTTNRSGAWETVPIHSGVVKGADTSIAVDANGKVHISCRNEQGVGSPKGGQGGLRYVTNASGEWTWYDVDTSPSAGNDGDIAVDGAGNVHISYLDKNAGLKYATDAGGSWEVEVVDDTPNVGWNTSIAIDGNNRVHISYSDPGPVLDPPGNGYLKYATNASGGWVTQVIDDRDAGFFTGLDVDSQDRVHIAYYTWDGSAGRLKYATNASGAWVSEAVDENGAVGLYSAIAVDSEDNPHVSYLDYINHALKYASKEEMGEASVRSPRLALWLARKEELLAHESASYDLVMTAWFEPAEAEAIRARRPSARLLAGLTHTWIMDDPEWLTFLLTVANGGDPDGPLQVTDEMYLMFDDDGDGALDRRCSPPDWPDIYAMDPRHPIWRQLILAFYATVARQPQHDGVIVDMVDAYSFCEGARSGGVPTPMDAATWVAAQDELLDLIRERVAPDKWVFANAGRDFPVGSPFPQHLNGYLLENSLGEWGASPEEGLASAQRALAITRPPHVVVFAVDTDDTGTMDWARFRTGLVASLLLDNTYFAFDYGPRDHGGVADWWFPQYYEVALGAPLGPYNLDHGLYRRDFEKGAVIAATTSPASVTFTTPHRDIATGEVGISFIVPQGDARIFVTLARLHLPLVIR